MGKGLGKGHLDDARKYQRVQLHHSVKEIWIMRKISLPDLNKSANTVNIFVGTVENRGFLCELKSYSYVATRQEKIIKIPLF